MFASATSTHIYLPLFGGGGTAAPPKNGLTWGLETLDLFQRPISSANPVLAADKPYDASKPIDPVTGLALGPFGFENDGYFDWVNEMIAFREAARLSAQNQASSGNGSGSTGTTQPETVEGSSQTDGTDGGTTTESSAAGSTTNGDSTTDSGTGAGDGGSASGGTDNGDDGLLGWLLG